MHIIDWLLMFSPLAIVAGIALYARRYVKSVAGFMSGGRLAGRYLLCTAGSEMIAGSVLLVASYEQFRVGGFAVNWWGLFQGPLMLIIAVSGFIGYRFRQTRAMTLGQFFEMRYSRRFRLFAGWLGFLAGLMNYGVIPAVGARFFVYFLGMPEQISLFHYHLQTCLVVMICLVTISVLLSTSGGQVTILLVNCCEGMISSLFYVVIAIAIVCTVSWAQMSQVLTHGSAGQSLINPFDTGHTKDFNMWYVLMLMAMNIYGINAWQNASAMKSSAITPHDGRMAGILWNWRCYAYYTMLTVLGLGALTVLQHVDYAAQAAAVQDSVSHISNPHVAKQMVGPIALSHLLPPIIKGMLCCVFLMGDISANAMHLHSWGSIFIQDAIVPLRKTPLSTRGHLLLLRLAIISVAIFAIFFGSFVTNIGELYMWWGITQGVYVSGAGIVIIGGLYWSRGTAPAAWISMILGGCLALGGILLREYWVGFCNTLLPNLGMAFLGSSLRGQWRDFPLNGIQVAFYTAMIVVIAYAIVAVMTCRQPHNMDQLLHRGRYAVEAEESSSAAAKKKRVPFLFRLQGIDEHFTLGDKWIALGAMGMSLLWLGIFIVGTVWNLWHPICVLVGLGGTGWDCARPWSDDVWLHYSHIMCVWFPLILGVLTTIWFTIGCTKDMRIFFRRLKEEKVDAHDDGTVSTDEQMRGKAVALAPAALDGSVAAD